MSNSRFAFQMWAQALNTRGFSLPIKLSFVQFKFFHDIIDLKQKLKKSQNQTGRILWFPGQPFTQHEHRLQQLCITGPQNGLGWSVDGTFRDHLIQSSCPGQAHLSLHQPQLCLTVFKFSENRCFTRCPGTTSQGFSLPMKIFPCVPSVPSKLWFLTTVPCYTVWHHWEEFAFRLLEILNHFSLTFQADCP